jgi:hypothetical protein
MPRDGDVNGPTREFPEDGQGDRGVGGDAPGPRRSFEGRGRGLLGLAGVLAAVVAGALLLQSADLLPRWRNPFAEEVADRSQPPLLKSIQDLSRYVAAEGNFEVVIDLQKDRRYVPDFLLGERILFVGAGTVESYVDFGALAEGAVVESADRRSVEITLPAPQLGEVNLDLARSYVFAERRGLIDHLGDFFNGDPNRQRQTYLKAEERIAAAARDSGLTDRARENTRKMLEGLLGTLGYHAVVIHYAVP